MYLVYVKVNAQLKELTCVHIQADVTERRSVDGEVAGVSLDVPSGASPKALRTLHDALATQHTSWTNLE